MASLLFAVVASAGCAHSHAVEPAARGGDPRGASGSAADHRSLEVKPRHSDEPPVASASGGMVKRDGAGKIQRALGEHGLAVTETGTLDDSTQAAILKFQRREGLPATGLPDNETLRRLGLDPQEIKRLAPRTEARRR